MSWASNDCVSKKGAANTTIAEEAIKDIFTIAESFCDAATLLGTGDAQTWGLPARWQVATSTILNRLSGMPVTQFSGDQLWSAMDRRDSWHASDTPQNRVKIGIFLWRIVKANLYPWLIRRALGKRSIPDGQNKYRVSLSFAGLELAHELGQRTHYRDIAREVEKELAFDRAERGPTPPRSEDEPEQASPADERGESSAIQKGPAVISRRPGAVVLTERQGITKKVDFNGLLSAV